FRSSRAADSSPIHNRHRRYHLGNDPGFFGSARPLWQPDRFTARTFPHIGSIAPYEMRLARLKTLERFELSRTILAKKTPTQVSSPQSIREERSVSNARRLSWRSTPQPGRAHYPIRSSRLS